MKWSNNDWWIESENLSYLEPHATVGGSGRHSQDLEGTVNEIDFGSF